MRALQLDFQRQSKPLPWLGLGLLTAALAVCLLLGGYYHSLQRLNDTWEAKLDRLDRLSSRAARMPRLIDAQAERTQMLEVRQANLVLRQLRMPWNDLFRAVEDSAGKDVALLGLEPDTRNGTVKITGEAKHLDAVLDFVKELGSHEVFSSVFLQNHQVQQKDPQRPLRFSLLAAWKVDTP